MNTKISLKKTIALLSAAALTMAAPNYAAAANNAEDTAANPAFGCTTFNDAIHCWILKLAVFDPIPISTHVPASPFRVFSEDGSEFLGTELHMRIDLSNPHPCPQNSEGEWSYVSEYKWCHAE